MIASKMKKYASLIKKGKKNEDLQELYRKKKQQMRKAGNKDEFPSAAKRKGKSTDI